MKLRGIVSHKEQPRVDPEPSKPLPPTVSIYQNPDYVEGILQQTYGQPLFTEFANEARSEHEDSQGTTNGAKAKVGLAAKFPGLFAGDAAVEADYEKRLGSQQITGSTATARARYTQPYYLHVVRSVLRQTGLIRDVKGRGDATNLRPGEFVEFSASFTPSQVVALLDIATPDLVEQIVRRSRFTEGMDSFEGGTVEKVQEFKLRLDGDMETWGAIGRAATEAVRADFRSAKTREFYGQIGDGDELLTFITMCDVEHFVVADEDRILDGHFTVLGKVAGPLTQDEPILSRNKVLERMRPEAVDELVRVMNESVHKQAEKVSALTQADDEDDDESAYTTDRPDRDGDGDEGNDAVDGMVAADMFNFTLDSRVIGASVRVIPIAIYL
ncbi:DUF6414 family protein [Arthrobacter sp. KK5.5]|uniref:DUF6414 family protein n=1 Tax=Arthrobacter sp. KK5.5 TaxID=3373084 RepID=UPI003EE55DDE